MTRGESCALASWTATRRSENTNTMNENVAATNAPMSA
jgi:hypothetical protein